MFAVVTTRFRKSPGYIIAFLEFLWGSGTMVGAAIGGALIDVWDFPLPFFVLGVITILMFPIIVKIGRNLNNAGGKIHVIQKHLAMKPVFNPLSVLYLYRMCFCGRS
ncbi:unnamed protein product [Ixodes pacificus]